MVEALEVLAQPERAGQAAMSARGNKNETFNKFFIQPSLSSKKSGEPFRVSLKNFIKARGGSQARAGGLLKKAHGRVRF